MPYKRMRVVKVGGCWSCEVVSPRREHYQDPPLLLVVGSVTETNRVPFGPTLYSLSISMTVDVGSLLLGSSLLFDKFGLFVLLSDIQ